MGAIPQRQFTFKQEFDRKSECKAKRDINLPSPGICLTKEARYRGLIFRKATFKIAEHFIFLFCQKREIISKF